ncbi:MAG: response regulator [Oculatellaceae cyanobacterium Prado106]|nr:response regulator [Oculatellaceae cyanobacterium Prado106]
MTTKTILLIHGESSVRELVQACLQSLGGWQVLVATSSAEGLQRSTQDRPDAIVLDVPSYGKSYLPFLQQLRANPVSQDIPVIVLTVGAKWLDGKQLKQFQVVGAIDYITDPSQISDQVATLLQWEKRPFVWNDEA